MASTPTTIPRASLPQSSQHFVQTIHILHPHPTTTTPLADIHAISALNHAITVTNIIKTVLTEMDIFNVWYLLFNIQWYASLTVMAFALAYPICPPAPAARKASATSISIFEFFGFKCLTATEKAVVLRDLDSKSRWCFNLGGVSTIHHHSHVSVLNLDKPVLLYKFQAGRI
jgi:hypothetical protein